jgi:hypothetical protein
MVIHLCSLSLNCCKAKTSNQSHPKEDKKIKVVKRLVKPISIKKKTPDATPDTSPDASAVIFVILLLNTSFW